MRRKPPRVCPVCGEDVPEKAQACPECGACHESGWRQEGVDYDGLDLPDEAYEEEPRRSRNRPERQGLHPMWKVAALLVLAAAFWWFWRQIWAVGRMRWW